MRERESVDPDGRVGGEELRGVAEGKKIIKIYYMRKKIYLKNK